MVSGLPISDEDKSAECAKEPIHVPGSIQPHGYLVSISDEGSILQASKNIEALAGLPIDRLIGRSLSEAIGKQAAALALDALKTLDTEAAPLYAGVVGALVDPLHTAAIDHPVPAAHQPHAVIVHRYNGVTIVELEPTRATSDVFASIYPLVRMFISSLEAVQTIEELGLLAAGEVRRITGYGRVMVYNFDKEGHGIVLAESLDQGYDSYLGQRFPASDIPPQARSLYVRNRIRLIADADYEPVALEPAKHPATGQSTDLTYASLRSVSPVHVQYMKNMGTLSSMSMSIVVRGKLWGLISCHHASARIPPFEVRSACEHIAQVLSLQIEAKEKHAEANYRLELRLTLSRLLASMANKASFIDALVDDGHELLALAGATGAVIVFEGRIVRIGLAPEVPHVEHLVEWLDTQPGDLCETDTLGGLDNVMRGDPDFAGVMAVSISKLFRNYVIWFRGEVIRTIEWAGDPRAKLAGLSPSISPRESFNVWTETVRGRAPAWREAEREIALEFRTALLGIVLRRAEELAQLALELGRANKELEGFSYSVSHDLRAPLRHISGFADLLLEMESENLSKRGLHFVERISTSARFGGKLVDDLLALSQMGRAALRPTSVDVRQLVETLITDTRSDIGERRISWNIGELGRINADAVLIQVVFRNLIDNAVKFTATREEALIEIACEDGTGKLEGQNIYSVRDNGVGFDMRYVDKLFGVFHRLHRFEEFPGTGIGLASVKRIVERHGGAVWATGVPEQGATLYFSLPLHFAPDTRHGEEGAAAAFARLEALSPGKPTRQRRQPPQENKERN